MENDFPTVENESFGKLSKAHRDFPEMGWILVR